jgi:hypothetical protein
MSKQIILSMLLPSRKPARYHSRDKSWVETIGNERSAFFPLTKLRDKFIRAFSPMPPLVVNVRRGRHELFQLLYSRKKKHKMQDKLKQRAINRFLV